MDICRLMLVVEALKKILICRGYTTEDEFEKTLLELDLEDGIQEGIRTQKKVPRKNCAQCGRVNRKRSHCYFCGQPLHVAGRVEQRNRNCPKCRKKNAPRRQMCLYCGTSLSSGKK